MSGPRDGRLSRARSRATAGLAPPGAAVLIGLVAGALIMLLNGDDPIVAYREMFDGAFGGQAAANLVSTINRATPIAGLAVAAAVAFRAGLFNIGLEGQLVLGGVTAAAVALYAPLPGPVLLAATVIAGTLAGGLYALLATVLEDRFEVPILIGTLLLNFPARLLAAWIVTSPLRQPGSSLLQTEALPPAATIPEIPGANGMHWGTLIVVLSVVAAWLMVERTVVGYELRMSGLNARFARFGGVKIGAQSYRTMFLSGALAGLVGVIEVVAVHGRYVDTSLTRPLYAWTGVMAALLARSTVGGAAAAALFFAALQNGGFGMERATDVPRELARVIQAVIILLVAVAAGLRPGLGRARHG